MTAIERRSIMFIGSKPQKEQEKLGELILVAWAILVLFVCWDRQKKWLVFNTHTLPAPLCVFTHNPLAVKSRVV